MKKYYEPELVKKHVPLEPIPDEVRAQFLRPGELLSILDAFPVAYQPLGTLEWHGRQNPLGCDSIKAERLCIDAAKKAGGVVMPTLYFSSDAFRDLGKGVGRGMDATAGFELPGSFYQIGWEQLQDYLVNACTNYLARGFKLVIIVSGHNPGMQQNVMDEVCYIMKEPDGREPVVTTMEYKVIEEGNPRRHSDHAGGYETSMMCYLAGDRVNMKANDNTEIPGLAVGGKTPWDSATAAEGQKCFELQVEGMAKYAKEKLKKLTD